MNIKQFLNFWPIKYLLIAIASFFCSIIIAYYFLEIITHHGQSLCVPSFENMSFEQAKKIAKAHDMKLEIIDSVYIRGMERGYIYRQNPDSGSRVKSGRRILLTINSMNPRKVLMPNLIGSTLRQARAELSAKGLTLGKLIYVPDIATNNVLNQQISDQDVEPGERIDGNSSINLVLGLNKGDDKTFVPNVVGMTYLHAIRTIHDNYLNVGSVSFNPEAKNYRDSLSAVVSSQSPQNSPYYVSLGASVNIKLQLNTRK